MQAIGMWLMGIECLIRFKPDILIDTEGCAFAYPVFSIARVPIVSYVHYPFISSDMMQAVANQSVSINNSSLIARSGVLTKVKSVYYGLLSRIYGFCGSRTSCSMANSEWTLDHLGKVWPRSKCTKVFPPCDLESMEALDLHNERKPVIFSLSQFRPEKNQNMQIHVMKRLFEIAPEWMGNVKLVMCGGCRNDQDLKRSEYFKQLAEELGIEGSVEIQVNPSHKDILDMLAQASIGIHTMKEEHFGISIVEFMASGVITVANNSGGPKSDIIHPDEDGFLCSTIEEYAQTIKQIISMPKSKRLELRTKARHSAASRFSANIYEDEFLANLETVLTAQIKPT
jgi:alpha-1,2-mannosyltransferase